MMKNYQFFLTLVFLLLNCIHAHRVEEVFTTIYNERIWGINNEGHGSSGIGSTVEATKEYRAFLQDFLHDFSITSAVDLGCGDWEFSQCIDWAGIDYTGIDIVKHIIEKNKKHFEGNTIRFAHANALTYNLPPADLLICKEVLQHLSNDDIKKICAQFKKYKYCLITNGISYYTGTSDNSDIFCGDYRDLDLTQPPFNIEGIRIFTFFSAGFLKQTLLIIN